MQKDKFFLYLLDSTSSTLKGLGYDDWTKTGRRRNTQGIKLHLLMSAQDAVPQYCTMTNANALYRHTHGIKNSMRNALALLRAALISKAPDRAVSTQKTSMNE